MNKAVIMLEQPAFVEDIVRKVCNKFLSPIFTYKPGDSTDPAKMPKTEREYIVTRPDYSSLIGNNNMLRTSIHIANKKKEIEAKEDGSLTLPSDMDVVKSEFVERVASISNLQYKEEGSDETSTIVVFQTNTQNPKAFPVTVTRHYVSKEYLDNKIIRVAYCEIRNIDDDIHKFLTDGKTPA